MKNIYTVFSIVLGLLIFSVAAVDAAPYNAADKNPQQVAFHEEGVHGIPTQPGVTHTGTNMVKQNGNSGNFQAWFWGTSDEEGEHGHHEVWKISKDGSCPNDAVFIPDAHENWGDYLIEDADYCVMVNEYHTSHAEQD